MRRCVAAAVGRNPCRVWLSLVLALVLTPVLAGAEPGSDSQAIRSAKTAADHRRLADMYERRAAELRELAREQREMAK